METLITVGALSAFGFSTLNLLSGSIHLYYDTACMLITLVLLGKILERRAKDQVLEGLEGLLSLMPSKVRIVDEAFPEGRFVAAEQLAAGDLFRVAENEIVAADGVVVSGGGASDESSITGEPRPVMKKPGDPIRSGSRLHHGSLTVCADKVGAESTLGQMIAVVQNTLTLKTPGEGRTEKILQWFVPAILVLAAATGVCGLAARAGRRCGSAAGRHRHRDRLPLRPGDRHPARPRGRRGAGRPQRHAHPQFFSLRTGGSHRHRRARQNRDRDPRRLAASGHHPLRRRSPAKRPSPWPPASSRGPRTPSPSSCCAKPANATSGRSVWRWCRPRKTG